MLIQTPDQYRILAFYRRIRAVEELERDSTKRRYSYVEVDPNDLRIFDRKCFATFAGEGELVVLLKDDDSRQRERNESN
jgi:hypothetical protein